MENFIQNTVFYKLYKKYKAKLANLTYGFPSKDMTIIGITGTDGKTTTTNIIHKILNDNLGKTALVSTVLIRFGDKVFENKEKMTSFDPFKLQGFIAQAKEEGCKYMVLEVSSHGIDQYRFEGIEFDGAVLTNITPEHLDYHKTIENYAETKKKLFKSIIWNKKPQKIAVLPKDDEFGRKWLEDLTFDKAIDYGIFTNALLKGEDIKEYIDHTDFKIKYLGKTYDVSINLVGKYNVQNILAGVGVGIALGIPIEQIIDSIQSFQSLPGRMQNIKHNLVNYFVDFAHTPNALENTLKFIKNIKENGRIITVFGAPGNRDRYKRPVMGNVVEKYSDIIILTDDDPDTENRFKIINEVAKGIQRQLGDNYYIIPERYFAIKLALDLVKPNDIVLFAGKGHEKIQYTNFGKRKRSDVEVLKTYLNI